VSSDDKVFFDYISPKRLICAHRGARSIAPENTLFAMKKARECGASCWETDIRMSRDGELVLFHDDTLERTTDIATHKAFQKRKDWHVDQFTVRELSLLDTGSWFLADDPFGTVANGEVDETDFEAIREQQIPQLRDVLHFTKTYSFPVNLEIKDLATSRGDVLIVDKLIDMLRETETMDFVLLSSFRQEYLYRARALSQDIPIAVLGNEKYSSHLIRHLNTFPAVAYHPDKAVCDTELVVNLQQAGIRVNSWTVNDMQQAREFLHMGAGVITDWPQCLT
jgi:glycerophosphoryl diester phosphodiesterase